MLIRTIFAFLLLGSTTMIAGTCPLHGYSNPDQVELNSESVMIVTHPSIDFDGRMSTKVGMDAAVVFAKNKKIPVLYLQDDAGDEKYFWNDCSPDHWLSSAGGEISVKITPSHVYTVGGHWELCQSSTINDVLVSWSKQPLRDLKITIFMDAVYMKASMSFEQSDPYYNDFTRFVGIVNYDRSMSEAFNNKITMHEAMGIIIKQDRQLEFLIRSLPQFQRTLPNHRTVIQLGSLKKVLYKGKGKNPPTLTFDFVNTAIDK